MHICIHTNAHMLFELGAEVDRKQQLYLLLFRGILFAFPIWNVVSPLNRLAGY